MTELLHPRILFWNINGRARLLRSDFINNWLISNCDILFLSETHFTKGQQFDIENFYAKHNPFSTVDDKYPRGGISCFVKKLI